MTQRDSQEGGLASLGDTRPRWTAERAEANLARTHARLRLRRRTMRTTLAVAVAATLTALLLVVLVRRHGSSDGAVARVDRSVSEDRQTVHFQDGSSVELLDPRSQLDVGFASDDAIDVSLVSGSGHFDVTPRPQRRFIVHAGDIDVIVVGTSFRVTRDPPHVHVAVDHGRVQVRYPGGTRFLTAGESSWFPPYESATNDESAALPESAARESAATPAPGSPDLRSAQKRFTDHVNKGEYPDAFAVLERWPQVAGTSPRELMLAADAARLSNHPAQAVAFLERITREYPKDALAPLASFTAGRILLSQLGRPADAADAFALTRRLSPSGPLAEDGLAREAEASSLAGALDRARALSDEYVRTYPKGRRLHSVQQRGSSE